MSFLFSLCSLKQMNPFFYYWSYNRVVSKGWFLNNAVNSQRDISSNNKKVGVNHQRAEGPPLGRQITEKDVVDIQLENFKGDLSYKY